VMQEVKREAKRRRIELLILPTIQAIEVLERVPGELILWQVLSAL